MDLLQENPKDLFFKYFKATISSSMIMTIYSIVDTICIGRYEGANGTAAIACFFPLYTILFAFGLLFGIGGSVLMAQKRGEGDKEEGDKYFTVGLIVSVFISIILFLAYNLFTEQLLKMCGASGEILNLTMAYAHWIALFSPLFLLGQYLILFIRNDGAPMYTTIAAIAGGIFNIFGDVYFIFKLDMGIEGAGLATAIGQLISFIVLLLFFFRKKCTLKIYFTKLGFAKKLKQILMMGSNNFIVDIAMGLLAIIFNWQIMKYLGAASLGIYGVVSNISTIVQTFGYAVGESAQAIISINHGARNKNRIRATVNYASITAFIIGLACFIGTMLFPKQLIQLYMTTTPEILSIAPAILRSYSIAFVFLVFNVFVTYYFQSINKPMLSVLISLLRGCLVSGILLFILPMFFGGFALWFAVPLAESIVIIIVFGCMKKSFSENY